MASPKSIALYWGIRRYLNECERLARKPKTLRWYEQKLHLFRVYMAEQYHIASAGLVRYAHVQAFLAALQDEERMRALSAGTQGALTDATVNGYSQVLKAFFAWCESRGYVRFNPTKVSSDLRQVYPKLRGASSRRDFSQERCISIPGNKNAQICTLDASRSILEGGSVVRHAPDR